MNWIKKFWGRDTKEQAHTPKNEWSEGAPRPRTITKRRVYKESFEGSVLMLLHTIGYINRRMRKV